MIASTQLTISLINLISLGLGGISVVLMINLTRRDGASYLDHFFYFLVCAVISGFCDWIIFNWVLLLVPALSSNVADSIYHIFWDLIGFPSALFALYFLIRALNGMLKLEVRSMNYKISTYVILLLIMLSYAGFYFRLQGLPNLIGSTLWIFFLYIIPAIKISYLAFAYYKSGRQVEKDQLSHRLILLLLCGFLLWHLLSLLQFQLGVWRHLIILSYYLALFIPTIYLFNRNYQHIIDGENYEADKMKAALQVYRFTTREIELMRLLLAGKSNKEISEELFVSLQTVKNYVSKVYKKAGLKNRVQFVNFVRKQLAI